MQSTALVAVTAPKAPAARRASGAAKAAPKDAATAALESGAALANAELRDPVTAGAIAQLESVLAGIRGDVEMDAVAFADGEAAGEREAVEQLIEEEMRTFAPADYLSGISESPLPSVLVGEGAIAADLARVEAGAAPEALRADAPGPPPPGASPETAAAAWTAATAPLRVRAEELAGQAAVVALLERFGPDAWASHNGDLGRSTEAIQLRTRQVEAAADAVNALRKREGVALAAKLERVRRRREEAEQTAAALEVACAGLEAKRPRLAQEAEG
ncbi:hypothetical protein FNF27_01035 [Cafeteria roenbergensis]|uniref:Uncharacterized protein n=1 Tax=Cafeteria roenbergensis TaxID=33653 RepID=A0A5A8DUW7_CAFRO|nr:hypothetical protein FNF29_00932 [Cafeteria roenbergensis]KAA0159308.1 hypothetical protein FNF31_04897 [Cafeteria roenbergensis]KAA0167581.1 hypothetical protein FNF28_02795 [Cafeteria roenbergensis]KAA0177255.1 hypothetical protein FNF27_01035 [Cafeteria roenbergensis]|mmetsp:Transcript_14664/g.55241  ORF Transcript_14664/g.55241 Transcript_14664/m.55241 type:complete len:274 (-) Transcript_14664:1272-2093(-)|eukprot:KAA0156822.1 hypothetical protein FNF29_00932 [Cafeteria roenbergensis]